MLTAAVSTACLYPRVVEEALYDLALAGVSGVEIFINTHSELREQFIDGLVGILNRFDMRCLSLHPFTSEIEPMLLFSNYERRVNDCLDYYRKYFYAMSKLGADIFVLHGHKAPVSAVNLDLYYERFGLLSKVGREYGVTVAQENVARCTAHSLDFLRNMNTAMGKEANFVIDIKQAIRAGEDPFELLRTLKENVVHIHLSDHGPFGDCLPIGKGRFRVDEFLKEVQQYNPNAGVVLELYRSGFSDVQELTNNYLLLQKKISLLNRKEPI